MSETTRFAPSPSGYLHLGHAFAAHFAQRAAGPGGRFLLRFEDIDRQRCKVEYERAIEEDLTWLGLSWEKPAWRQSEHQAEHLVALEKLKARGLLYPCFCTRRDIQMEIAAAGAAPQGPDGPLYPGTCRQLSASLRQEKMAAGLDHAWRLDVERAARQAGRLLWFDLARGEALARSERLGDVVLARKDLSVAYHLAVVVDDAAQAISLVTRGEDLYEATHLHRLLQALLDLPVPRWHHHRLILDERGQRLAKRNDALSLRQLRTEGKSPAEILAILF